MERPCPHCGSARLVPAETYYAAQIRLPEADPETLAPLAPPLRLSVLHGTLCITLFWLAVLGPLFVGRDHMLMVGGFFFLLGAGALVLWIRARKRDRAEMAAYRARLYCPDCGRIA